MVEELVFFHCLGVRNDDEWNLCRRLIIFYNHSSVVLLFIGEHTSSWSAFYDLASEMCVKIDDKNNWSLKLYGRRRRVSSLGDTHSIWRVLSSLSSMYRRYLVVRGELLRVPSVDWIIYPLRAALGFGSTDGDNNNMMVRSCALNLIGWSGQRANEHCLPISLNGDSLMDGVESVQVSIQ